MAELSAPWSRSQTYRTSTSGSEANVPSTPPPRPRIPTMQIEIFSLAATALLAAIDDTRAAALAAADDSRNERRFMVSLQWADEAQPTIPFPLAGSKPAPG